MSAQFIRLPLGISSRLLDDQDVAVVSSQTRSTITRAVNRLRCIEQARVAVGHVPAALRLTKTICRESNSEFSPLQRHVRSSSKILVVKRDVVVIANTSRSGAWRCLLHRRGVCRTVTRDCKCVRHLVSDELCYTAECRNCRVIGGIKTFIVNKDSNLRPVIHARCLVCERRLGAHADFLVASAFIVGSRVHSRYPLHGAISRPRLRHTEGDRFAVKVLDADRHFEELRAAF